MCFCTPNPRTARVQENGRNSAARNCPAPVREYLEDRRGARASTARNCWQASPTDSSPSTSTRDGRSCHVPPRSLPWTLATGALYAARCTFLHMHPSAGVCANCGYAAAVSNRSIRTGRTRLLDPGTGGTTEDRDRGLTAQTRPAECSVAGDLQGITLRSSGERSRPIDVLSVADDGGRGGIGSLNSDDGEHATTTVQLPAGVGRGPVEAALSYAMPSAATRARPVLLPARRRITSDPASQPYHVRAPAGVRACPSSQCSVRISKEPDVAWAAEAPTAPSHRRQWLGDHEACTRDLAEVPRGHGQAFADSLSSGRC